MAIRRTSGTRLGGAHPRIERRFGGASAAVTNPTRPAELPAAEGVRGAQQRSLSERGGNIIARALPGTQDPARKRRRLMGAASEVLGL